MIPLRIKLENFMSHRYTDIDLSEVASVLIVGKRKNDSRQSNGVGKTTIFYAIDFALFGEYPTSTIDKIVRDGTEFCKVIFDFEMDNETYRVIRERNSRINKSSLALLKAVNDEWEPIETRTNSHLVAELQSIIKINYKAFKQSVLFSQMDLSGLSEAKTSDARRKILKSTLSLEVYNKLEEIAKNKLKDVRVSLEETREKVFKLGQPDSDIKELKAEMDNLNIEIKNLQKDLEINQKIADKLKQDIIKFELLSGGPQLEIQSEIKQLLSRKQDLQNKINRVDEDIVESNNNINTLTNDAKTALEKLSKLNDELEAIETSKFRSIEDINIELEKIKEKESNKLANIKSLNHKSEELRAPMPDGENCPHCRQPLTDEHRDQCLKKAAEDLDRIDKEIFLHKKDLESILIKRKELEKEISNVIDSSTRKQALFNEINIKHDGILKDKSYIDNLKKRLERLEKDKKSYEDNFEDLLKRLEKIQLKYDASDTKKALKKIKELNFEIKSVDTDIKSISNKITNITTEKGKISQKIEFRKNDKKDLEEYNKSISLLMEEYKVRQMTVKGLGTSGIPTMIIYTILDDLQIEANNRLASLRPEIELQFKIIKDKDDGNQEDVLDLCYKVLGQDREYKQLSGGQRLIVALSLKLALASVIQKRLGINIRFLALDEVDQSLDKAGIDAFIDIIKELQKEYKIFIITHNDYLKDKFENAILVENDGKNGSVARLVSSW